MIAIIALLLAVGIAFNCYEIGKMKGFREGMDYADELMEKELKKRWEELNEQNK